MRYAFSPREFFDEDVSPQEEIGSMWVYRKVGDNLWAVGFFLPDKSWSEESTHTRPEDAAARVRWLNGGDR